MAEESFQEKTEQPTQKRIRDALEKGNVPRSVEVNSLVVLLLGTLLLFFTINYMIDIIRGMFNYVFLDYIPSFHDIQDFSALQTVIFPAVGSILLPFFAVVLLGSFLAGALQTGFVISTEPLVPKAEKISPIRGFKRIFSLRGVMELVKSLLKLTAVGLVIYFSLVTSPEKYLKIIYEGSGGVLHFLGITLGGMMIRVLIVLLLIAILDFGYQRWQWQKDLRMTKQELKEENKQTEGDPLVRSRIRSIQYEMARKRMMAKVPEADVVITNPIHYAVALKYDYETMNAPQCVAKGQRKLAEKIKAIALEHGIPVLENPPLARALFHSLEVGEEIPVQFYQIVAEILAEVYRMRKSA